MIWCSLIRLIRRKNILCWFNIYHDWEATSISPLGGIMQRCSVCLRTRHLIYDSFYKKVTWDSQKR